MKEAQATLELGNLIKTMEPIIPGKILVFFPSYGLMHHVINVWDEQIL
jgi:Rad3-related DNA helicase